MVAATDHASDLSQVFHIAFARGHYERAIDYADTDGLRFAEPELTWVIDRSRTAKL